MKYFPVLIMAGTLLLASCNNKKATPAETKTDSAAKLTAEPVPDRAADSAAIRKTVTDFYNWYNKNNNKLLEYHLYRGVKNTDHPPYHIDWKEVERYQQYLQTDARWLGQEFIQSQYRFFQSCDSAFKVDKEDEIPYGFDYDWYTNSQEDASYLVDQVNKSKPWPVKWSGDYATVDIMGDYDNNGKQQQSSFVNILMKKENNEWKIARIGNEE